MIGSLAELGVAIRLFLERARCMGVNIPLRPHFAGHSYGTSGSLPHFLGSGGALNVLREWFFLVSLQDTGVPLARVSHLVGEVRVHDLGYLWVGRVNQ